jgi:hypothetical protein
LKIITRQEEIPTFASCTNLFISPEWLNVITKTYGFRFQAVVDELHQLALPFCQPDNRFFPSVKSIPFGDYTLINCDEEHLNRAMQFLLRHYPHDYVETSVVSTKKPETKNFRSKKYGFLIQIDIKNWENEKGGNEVYERNIRHAVKQGLTVKTDRTMEGVERFYLLHEKLRIEKFGKLPQPVRFFHNIYTTFVLQDKGFLLEAWKKDVLVASWFILSYKDILYYKFGASHSGYLHLRPNDLLFRSLIQYGSDHQYKKVDLGFSGASKSYEGLLRFKSKEGGRKIPIYHIERYPENFDMNRVKKRKAYLSALTQKAIDSGNLATIRTTSEHHYGEFA